MGESDHNRILVTCAWLGNLVRRERIDANRFQSGDIGWNPMRFHADGIAQV
jgi:hypothetical protein